MQKYFILGSGGFAKEVHFFIEQSFKKNELYFGGFIDVLTKTITNKNKEHLVWEENQFLNDHQTRKNDIWIFNGIGTPCIIQMVTQKFSDFIFPNLIHPSFIGDLDSIQIGIGNIITPGCLITVDIKIGNFNVFNQNVTIGHDCDIGNYNVFNPGSNISGCIKIGSTNLFGVNSAILENLKVGSNSIIGGGALVTKPIPDFCLAIGIPAKIKPIHSD